MVSIKIPSHYKILILIDALGIFLIAQLRKITKYFEIMSAEDIELEDVSPKIHNKNSYLKNNKVQTYIIDKNIMGNNNVVVMCIIKPTIFITNTVYRNLSENELNSILLHEIGHIEKKHNLKRETIKSILLWFSFYGLSTINTHEIQYSTMLIGTGIALQLIANKYFKKQEFDADKFAVSMCNNKDDLINALEKMELMNKVENNDEIKGFDVHPKLEKRISRIENIYNKNIIN